MNDPPEKNLKAKAADQTAAQKDKNGDCFDGDDNVIILSDFDGDDDVIILSDKDEPLPSREKMIIVTDAPMDNEFDSDDDCVIIGIQNNTKSNSRQSKGMTDTTEATLPLHVVKGPEVLTNRPRYKPRSPTRFVKRQFTSEEVQEILNEVTKAFTKDPNMTVSKAMGSLFAKRFVNLHPHFQHSAGSIVKFMNRKLKGKLIRLRQSI